MRRYLQFGLRTILWLTVVVAVAVSWWRQRSLRAEIDATREQAEATREQMRQLEAEMRLRECVGAVCMAVDLRNPRDVQTLTALQDANWRYLHVERQQLNGCDVILFYDGGYYFSGRVTGGVPITTCAAFLIKWGYLTDVFVPKTESLRKVRFEDFDQDGQNDLVFHYEPHHSGELISRRPRGIKIAADRFLEIAGPLDAVPSVD